ncbi:MAG: circularly permuted type 2 ATP-grasp protein [Atopobiaceae bacterium]|jgi:uncharacterized circularly permuted ATP-grasp superfamily protein|nr:circularly permuted type 2 ATP-grasp protein [Atopobiaceae bacterium]MDD2587365.1 circularly permuted type 2 ATP-grasp protein [Atopobiaceae bacterium]MDD3486681.1 circularly permuted type 2 ATP-grasp protein [Atopobiaceae bacterium]
MDVTTTAPTGLTSLEPLMNQRNDINADLARNGVRFGVYKDGTFNEQIFPYDPVPRVIDAPEFERLSAGLTQRVRALNAFLHDIYSQKQIIRDKVIPEDFVYSSSGYLPQVNGLEPPSGIHAHIAGEDLVQAEDGTWYVLEDNLRIPSGASYPLIARQITRRVAPAAYAANHVRDNRDYPQMLADTMEYCSCGGIPVILTPGRYNAAFFEHSYLAEKTGATLVYPSDLISEGGRLYFLDYAGHRHKVGVVYRRISDEYLDPFCFKPESVIGVPNLMGVYRAGNVALVNAPGNGVADDKGIYYFVPRMIHYYLGEQPLLQNAPTYLPEFDQDLAYVLGHLDTLVVKDVAEAGGYGVVFGDTLTKAQLADLAGRIRAEPRRFIAQEVVHFRDLPSLDAEGRPCRRMADLRAFVLTGRSCRVWASGLTRYSSEPGSMVVNSSQGGGFKDTWVLSR